MTAPAASVPAVSTVAPRTASPVARRSSEPRRYSLWFETVVSLAILATTALLLALVNLALFDELIVSRYAVVLIGALVMADLAVFVIFGISKLRTLVIAPLEEVARTSEAIAAGDLTRRVPPGPTTEFAQLAASLNYMTARLLEEQAQQARLEKTASLGRLASGVGRQIEESLNLIDDSLGRVRRVAPSDEAALEAELTTIERERDAIATVVTRMIDYAQPRRRTELPIDVNGTVHRAMARLAPATPFGVALGVDLEPGVPDLSGDRAEFEQAVANLVQNAIEAVGESGTVQVVSRVVPFDEVMAGDTKRSTDPGEVMITRPPSARVRAWLTRVGTPKNVIKLVVADSGPGVPLGETERVFEPFYSTKSGRGAGLGLAVATQIIESLGGTIWVRTAREGGAGFQVLFPVNEPLDGGE